MMLASGYLLAVRFLAKFWGRCVFAQIFKVGSWVVDMLVNLMMMMMILMMMVMIMMIMMMMMMVMMVVCLGPNIQSWQLGGGDVGKLNDDDFHLLWSKFPWSNYID